MMSCIATPFEHSSKMSVKRKFTMDEVLDFCTQNKKSKDFPKGKYPFKSYIITGDIVNLCDIRYIGYKNVRWVADIYTDFGGVWVAEKQNVGEDEPFIVLNRRVCRLLNEICESGFEENKYEA